MYLVYTGRGVVVKSGGAGSYISHRAALQSCRTTPREHSKNFKTSRRVGRLVISAPRYFEQCVPFAALALTNISISIRPALFLRRISIPPPPTPPCLTPLSKRSRNCFLKLLLAATAKNKFEIYRGSFLVRAMIVK